MVSNDQKQKRRWQRSESQTEKLDLTVELQEQGELNEKIIMELRDLKITEGKTDIL